ncbi:3D domain-containing protein, partial [Escherichia coli]|uniref:3D domain-containing protein n=1 Tax=Escherichia coli TaxID=562 RepID=UPI0039089690
MKQASLTFILTALLAMSVPAITDRYTATAYCLKGRTASGETVRQGIIAADPRVLPLGTLVHLAGLGDYVVKDTGRLIKGHIIDIWMPTCKAARTWGRR